MLNIAVSTARDQIRHKEVLTLSAVLEVESWR